MSLDRAKDSGVSWKPIHAMEVYIGPRKAVEQVGDGR